MLYWLLNTKRTFLILLVIVLLFGCFQYSARIKWNKEKTVKAVNYLVNDLVTQDWFKQFEKAQCPLLIQFNRIRNESHEHPIMVDFNNTLKNKLAQHQSIQVFQDSPPTPTNKKPCKNKPYTSPSVLSGELYSIRVEVGKKEIYEHGVKLNLVQDGVLVWVGNYLPEHKTRTLPF